MEGVREIVLESPKYCELAWSHPSCFATVQYSTLLLGSRLII